MGLEDVPSLHSPIPALIKLSPPQYPPGLYLVPVSQLVQLPESPEAFRYLQRLGDR